MSGSEKLQLDSSIQLLHGDCLELLKTIPDQSIDLVLTDPPYGTTACKWDSIIPFEPMWEELKRISKNNSAIILFGQNPYTANLINSNRNMWRYDYIWYKQKGSGFLNANRRPLMDYEIASVFSKKQTKYFPQMVALDKPYKARGNTQSKLYGKFNKAKAKTYTHKHPSPILKFAKDGKEHPTQKPVALLEYLIKTYTKENDTVLDFTMGSGSTGVAAKNLNRKFIGIEKDAKYFEIAKKRIEANK